MKRVIVTGATGAVGTALVADLIAHGVEVLVLCREGSARNRLIPESPLVTRRYCDLSELSSLSNDTGYSWDAFYHLAWEGTTGARRQDMYLQNQNVRYALDAVAAAARFGCRTFIGVGSQAEYGRVEGVLQPSTPPFPETGYGMAKLAAGQMTRAMAHELGLSHCWVRILSIYGPNDGPQSMISTAIDGLRRGEVPRFTPAEQIWDYLYSADAAEALRLVGERGRDGAVYVLGSGQGAPLADYIRTLQQVVAPQGRVAIGALPYAPGQVMHLVADIGALRTDTGFAPHTDFRTGIALTAATRP